MVEYTNAENDPERASPTSEIDGSEEVEKQIQVEPEVKKETQAERVARILGEANKTLLRSGTAVNKMDDFLEKAAAALDKATA